MGVRIANATVAYVEYLIKMVWPAGLACYYPHPGAGLPVWQTIGSGALLAAITVLSVHAVRTRPYVLVGWLWYLITLLPVIGLVQVGKQALADRYTYVPLVGIFIMIAWGVPDALSRLALRVRVTALAAAATIAISALSFCAYRQAGYWKNNVTLYEHAISVTRSNILAHTNLGNTLLAEGEFVAAVPHLRAALEIDPRDNLLHNNLAFAVAQLGDIDDAIAHYEVSLRIDARNTTTHYQLGQLYARRGRIADAAARFRSTLKLDPGRSDAANNLAWILATAANDQLRNPGEAIRLAQRAVRATEGRPSEMPGMLDTLAAAYASAGRFSDAVATARRAIRMAEPAKQFELERQIEGRLWLYRKGVAYREGQ